MFLLKKVGNIREMKRKKKKGIKERKKNRDEEEKVFFLGSRSAEKKNRIRIKLRIRPQFEMKKNIFIY